MAAPKTYEMTRITWWDAHSGSNYLTEYSGDDVPHGPVLAYTVGYIVRQDEKGITSMAEYFPDEGTFRGRTFIPAGMVQKVEKLRLPAKRKPPVVSVVPPPDDTRLRELSGGVDQLPDLQVLPNVLPYPGPLTLKKVKTSTSATERLGHPPDAPGQA